MQGSAYTRVAPVPAERRLPWSHYLARPGVVEPIGKLDLDQIADGHLAFKPPDVAALDMAAVSSGALDIVQDQPGLDQNGVPQPATRVSMGGRSRTRRRIGR